MPAIVAEPAERATSWGPNYSARLEGGNLDERVPYIGYAGESEEYTAAGISAYNALQAHVEKRLSHGLQAGVSYAYSHSLDEQSALGLFYNGSNPLDLRGGYGNSDFDRTHVFNIDYHYELPNFYGVNSWEGKVADGWSVQGLMTLQSGQPYSVIDYSGAVGSIYYGINDGITNPIVPLAPGCTPKNAVTGATGNNFAFPALKASCSTYRCLLPATWAARFLLAIRSKLISFPTAASATFSGNPGKRSRTFRS